MSENFDYEDTSTKQQEDKSKYTMVDHLDEDPIIQNQRYYLASFVSPEGIMNCSIRALKIKGVYATLAEANAACAEFMKKDKTFDICVGEIGKWQAWDPTPNQAETVKYGNKKLDKMMQNAHQNELDTLNELVGKKKESLKKAKQTHEDRVKKSLLENAEEYNENTVTETPKENTKKPHVKKVARNVQSVKDRLHKKISDRKKEEQNQTKQNIVQENKDEAKDENKQDKEVLLNEINNDKEKIKQETERLTKTKEQIEKLNEKMKKFKDFVKSKEETK